ncbi:MAG: diacylglycerol kinase [Sphingomonadaceae bacterium]|nr:diacylglycerol kinase [Sphingomonadaceae bacterium]
MARVALLSNPISTGNRAYLPRIRAYCAAHGDLFHYEVEDVSQIGAALASIACVRPRVLVINGGDGTVQAALTELHHGGHFEGDPPPVAVLPNGKTNLIAMDLGSTGDPVVALERIIALAGSDLDDHVVRRELISLSEGENRAVLGMFMGGAGLTDAILYCRHKLYPLGLPNGLSHVLATIASFLTVALGISGWFLPDKPQPMRVSLIREGHAESRFALLIVTTLEKMLMGARPKGDEQGMKLMAIDRSVMPVIRALVAALLGKVGQQVLTGVHVEQGDIIRIDSDRSQVILDGEIYSTAPGQPITLRSTRPMHFLRLAA